jgi:hypothetical protein
LHVEGRGIALITIGGNDLRARLVCATASNPSGATGYRVRSYRR